MPIIRNLRKFSKIHISKRQQVLESLFTDYVRGQTYKISGVDPNDFSVPLTGFEPNFNGTPISSPYWSTRSASRAYQDDLLIEQSLSDTNTHSPSDSNNNYTGFIFNEATVSTVFILKPMRSGSKIFWPHTFYVIASNDGVNYDTISETFSAPYLQESSDEQTIALYDINPDKTAYTEYRLRMIGNSYNNTYQYIDALHWY